MANGSYLDETMRDGIEVLTRAWGRVLRRLLMGRRRDAVPDPGLRHGSSPPRADMRYFQLREAMEAPGCAVCRLAEEAVEASQRTLLYENVNDPGVREMLAESGGYCRHHAGRLVRRRDLLGTAIVHRDLVRRFRGGLGSSPPALERCPACVEHDETARRAITELTLHFDDPEIRSRFEASDGLCREHFYGARSAWKGRPDVLEAAQTACLSRLLEQLGDLIRKHDHRFRHEPVGDEGDSWLRAVAAVSGLDAEALPRPRSRHLPPVKEESDWGSPSDASEDAPPAADRGTLT
jgi:hypothetical protein